MFAHYYGIFTPFYKRRNAMDSMKDLAALITRNLDLQNAL
jgi:hypothetical protein